MNFSVNFFNEDVAHRIRNKRLIKDWIRRSVLKENKIPGQINIILCSDEYLLKLNKDFLSHDTLTDIITFDNSENGIASGDLYISYERVMENSAVYSKSKKDELHRVIIHGILHLCGYSDKTDKSIKRMREAEDLHLSWRPDELKQ